MSNSAPISELRNELMQLFNNMESVRMELAAIRRPDAGEDKIKNLAEHLDAIVEETERATETILGANERIEELVDKIGQEVNSPEIERFLDEIGVQVAESYQACAFQDITGQWVSKAADSLKSIDASVGRLVTIWGEEGLTGLPDGDEQPKGDDALLNGPQLGGVATSQDDIDKMFD